MLSLRQEINFINTLQEKENQFAVRRQTLLASQNVLSEEIDEVIKMLDPICLDDFPFKEKSSAMFEPSGKEAA